MLSTDRCMNLEEHQQCHCRNRIIEACHRTTQNTQQLAKIVLSPPKGISQRVSILRNLGFEVFLMVGSSMNIPFTFFSCLNWCQLKSISNSNTSSSVDVLKGREDSHKSHISIFWNQPTSEHCHIVFHEVSGSNWNRQEDSKEERCDWASSSIEFVAKNASKLTVLSVTPPSKNQIVILVLF